MSGTSTVHGVASVTETIVPTGVSASGSGACATIVPKLAPLSCVGYGAGASSSPIAPSTTAAAAGVRPRRSGIPTRTGTATVSATSLPFGTGVPGAGSAARIVPGVAGVCFSTREAVSPICPSRAITSSSGAPTISGTTTVGGVATTRETGVPSLTRIFSAGACSSTVSAGLASVITRVTSPSCNLAAASAVVAAASLRLTTFGTAMPVRSTSTSRNRCSSRLGSLRSTASASRATRRPVFAPSVAVPPKRPASRTSSGPSAISKVALASTVCASGRYARRCGSIRFRYASSASRPALPAGTFAPVPSAMCVRPVTPGSRARSRPTSSASPGRGPGRA